MKGRFIVHYSQPPSYLDLDKHLPHGPILERIPCNTFDSAVFNLQIAEKLTSLRDQIYEKAFVSIFWPICFLQEELYKSVHLG